MKDKFQSKAVPRGTRTIWRYLSALFILFTFAIGNVWAACPSAGTIYKFVVKTGLTNNSNITDENISITTSNYLSAFSGSTGATLSAYNKDKKFQIADQSCFKLTDGSKSYLILNLGECTLQAGDIVKTIITSQNAYLYTSTSKNDETKALITKSSSKTVYSTLSITSDMDVVGKSTLYLYNASNGAQVYSFEIIRPYTVTLDATTNGGTVSPTSVKGESGSKVVLPHPFKSGSTFDGWYISDVKQSNLYTITGDVTAVAKFKAIPESGEIFSLSMESDLKPAANCTIKTAAGFDSQVDMLTYATIEGGASFFKNASSNNHAIITSAGKFNFAGSNAVMEIPLDFALQNGDEIQTDFSAKIWVSAATTKPSSGPYVDGSNKNYTVTEGDGLKNATTLYLYTGSSGATASSIVINRPVPAATYTVTLNPDGGSISPVPSGWALTDGKYVAANVEENTSLALLALTREGYKLTGWKDGENVDYTSPVTVTSDLTLTAQWAQTYAVTYVPNNGVTPAETMTDDNAPYVAGEEVTLLANAFTAPENKEFDAWVVTKTASGDPITVTAGKFTMPAEAVTVTATWKDACALDPTVSATTLGTTSYTTQVVNCAGISVLGSAGCTISEYGYVYGTSTAPTISDNKKALEGDYTVAGTAFAETTLSGLVSNTKYYVRAFATNSHGTAYGEEISFTTLAPLGNVLVVAKNAGQTSDAITALRDNGFLVTVSTPNDSRDYTGIDLVVLDESLDGSLAQTSTSEASTIKGANIPILNLKAFFYTKTNRWNWGAPFNGTATNEIANISEAYCNAESHPIFTGLTIGAGGAIDLINPAVTSGNTLQGVTTNTLVEGKEGYTLATSGDGITFIHELTPAQRGVTDAKYLMVAISNNAKDNLSVDGEKLIVNAAKYLIGSTAWVPISVPTAAEVTATPSENYTEGNTITLTASATGTTASTTYTWYKGADWATASATTPVQAAATDGNVFTKTAALEDAGTYWCNISNGTSCDVQASVTITVSSASTPTHAIIYDNTKGADMTAYPTEYTEGVGVASFAALADIAGWHFVEWSPASIAADATTDQTITAVWAQVFEVTFDLQGHGAAIAAQNIVSGGKVTKPDDPIAIGWDFGGWFTDAECTAGNEFDFNTPITVATPLFAKWTEFDGCALLVPATSGAAPAVGDAIVMQTGSKGGSMSVVGTPLSYNDPYGLGFDSSASAKAKVTLNNEIQENTVITLTLVANGESARGLHIYSGDGATKITSLGWGSTIAKYTEATFTYTVQSTDVALIGSNEFQLWRNNSVWLKKLAVTACGDPVVFHNLTSAITPDNDPAYATVTLDASSVREGYTTKATYSAIDAGYEFDEWQISGTGASIADASANPAVITMGTTDAVITLKLKVATPKHTVTFNKMGKGDDVPSQLVAEGALVSEPSVAEPEGWMLEGWYKESTLENKWDFASDVMSTSDIELFANWVTDTSIKLINKSTGAINTTNFATAVAAEADVDGEKGASFSSARTAVTSISALGEMVQYNATTNQTKIQLSMYNTSTNQKTIYLFKVAEGDDAADVTEITIDGSSRKTTEYITFNSDKNRSFYVTVSDTKVRILQVKVVDDGTTPMKQFGQAGYSLNLNKGRVFAKNDGSAYPFEGGAIKVSSDYKVLNNSSLATKSYIQFNNAVANTILKVTRSGGNYYVSQDPADQGTAYNKSAEIVLDAVGTWYLGSTSSGSSASFTKVEFLAPKCAEPAFNALVNSDICSGDPYVALDGTATVADAGVPTYQWYREDDTEITGETNATYTPDADGKYYVIAVNHLAGFSDNEKKSDLVTVTTHTGTAITTGLADQRGNVDDVVVLEVVASGKNLHYAWKESTTIDGTYTDVAGAADAASLNVTITASMDKYYKVVVSSDCGADQESIAHVTQYVPVAQADVTGSIAWNWANAASVAQIKLTDTSAPKKNEGFVMANGAATIYNNANFESDKLYLEGEYIIRTEGGKLFQGQTIKFHTTVAGIVRVKFSHTGNGKPARELFVNGVGTGDSRTNTTAEWSRYVEVPAGDVSLTAFHVDPADGAGQQYIRVYEIEFLEIIDSRTEYAAKDLGTACYEYDAVVIGATPYMVAGVNGNGYIVFDEITSGVIDAGKPYLFEADGGKIFFCKPIGVTAAPLANGEEITVKGMVGTFSGTTLTQGEDDICYFAGRHIWRVNDFSVDIDVDPHRCYVNYDVLRAVPAAPAAAPGRRRVIMGVNGKDEAQGFENLESGDAPMKIMIDGTLYILRGEKVFDATGRLVK